MLFAYTAEPGSPSEDIKLLELGCDARAAGELPPTSACRRHGDQDAVEGDPRFVGVHSHLLCTTWLSQSRKRWTTNQCITVGIAFTRTGCSATKHSCHQGGRRSRRTAQPRSRRGYVYRTAWTFLHRGSTGRTSAPGWMGWRATGAVGCRAPVRRRFRETAHPHWIVQRAVDKVVDRVAQRHRIPTLGRGESRPDRCRVASTAPKGVERDGGLLDRREQGHADAVARLRRPVRTLRDHHRGRGIKWRPWLPGPASSDAVTPFACATPTSTTSGTSTTPCTGVHEMALYSDVVGARYRAVVQYKPMRVAGEAVDLPLRRIAGDVPLFVVDGDVRAAGCCATCDVLTRPATYVAAWSTMPIFV